MSKTKETDSRRRVLLELVIITGIGVFLFLLIPSFIWVYEIFSLIYILIERRIRHRPIERIGIKHHGIIADLKKNFPIIVLVTVVIQFGVVLEGYLFWSPLFLRLEDRVAYLQVHFGSFAPSFLFLSLIATATFLEELVFRGFVQERLSWFYNDFVSIIIASLLMSLFHYSSGPLLVVTVDLFFVFLDSSLYGLIYMRSRNVFAAWIVHLLADLVSLSLLWTLGTQ